ncbi:hypothetical protein [Pseudonocardia sp. NPDC049635]|uniref:hypothetical protein n=1 Tax=Pseudonocardia sp. NPDC049635 TaxID=3155506 RepID=UPI0033C9DA96
MNTRTDTTNDTTTAPVGDAMVDAAEEMGRVAELIERSAIGEARRRTARLADRVDDATRALLGQILAALEQPPAVVLPRLRALWKSSDDDGKALVEACVPHAERRAELTTQAQRHAAAVRAERRDYERRRPGSVVRRRGAPQPRRSQRATEHDVATRRYFAERTDPGEVTDEAPDYDQIDYDRAALAAMKGLPCVACGVERSTRDRQRSRDDGLCEDCREGGITGVPIPAADATRDEVLIARCEYIAATSASTAERNARLNRDWRCLKVYDRFTVSDWHARQPH